MTFDPALAARAAAILARARAKGWRIATAESCTGGLIAALLTEIAGSSEVVERGFVTYSNEAKAQLLGVPPELIAACGAVSEEVARAMAEGALRMAPVDLAVSVTGIAGPGGGTPQKPVGRVHLALARQGAPTRHERQDFGEIGRQAVRQKSLERALALIEDALD